MDLLMLPCVDKEVWLGYTTTGLMKKEDITVRKKTPLWLSVASAVIIPLFFTAMALFVILNWNALYDFFRSENRIEEWVAARGIAAPLFFIGVQTVQVIVFIIPGEVPQIAGGYLFGAWMGTVYSLIGILIGSIVNFYLARLLGVPFVRLFFKDEQVARMRTLAASPRYSILLFVFFLIPGIPKDALTYAAGLTRLSFLSFLIISGGGRLPGILGSAFIGSAASTGNWIVVIIISVAAAALFVVGYFFREQIVDRLHHFFDKEGD